MGYEIKHGNQDAGIPASELGCGEPGVVVSASGTGVIGSLIFRASREVVFVGPGLWNSSDAATLRVRRLKPGETVTIKGT